MPFYQCRECLKLWRIKENLPLSAQVPYPHTWNFDTDRDRFPIREKTLVEQLQDSIDDLEPKK